MRSISSSGPILYPSPTLTALSMSAAEATPASTARMASLLKGTSSALRMKPGRSSVRTGIWPQDAVQPAAAGGDFRDRQRGRVRGEDRVRGAHGVEPRQELALDRQLLEHGLDHEIAGAERTEIGAALQPRQDAVARLRRQLAALDRLGEEGGDLRCGAVERLGAQVVADGPVSGAGRHDGDAGAHGPGGAADADDAYGHFRAKLRPM